MWLFHLPGVLFLTTNRNADRTDKCLRNNGVQGEPPKVLRGFQKVVLTPGQTGSATFSMSEQDMSVWDTPSAAWASLLQHYYDMIRALLPCFKLATHFGA